MSAMTHQCTTETTREIAISAPSTDHTVCLAALHGTTGPVAVRARARWLCVVPILQINDVNVNDIATQPPGPRSVRESRVSWGARVV